MSKIKIANLSKHDTCRDPEHNPPQFAVYESGIYQHTCESCGKQQIFVVEDGPTL